MLTNARLLLPKFKSLVDTFQSLELHCAAITETWFKGGRDLRRRPEEIEDIKRIRVIHKSRDWRGKKVGGGVAIAFDPTKCNLKARTLKSAARDQEIVCAVGRAANVPRPIAVFALYIPPALKAADLAELCETLTTEVAAVKAAHPGVAIFVGGGLNHRNIAPALTVVNGFHRVETGVTRGSNVLDQVYSNIPETIRDARVLSPLETEGGVESDHKCFYVAAEIKKHRDYRWVVRMRRTRNCDRELAFAADLSSSDWSGMAVASGVSEMAAILEARIAELMEKHFPLARVRRRSNEDPWITRSIRRLWKQKIRLYKKNGKSQSWHDTDRKLQEKMGKSKEEFVEKLL